MTTALFDRTNDSFKRQGMMQHLGARLVRVAAGEVEFALPNSDKVTQQHATVIAVAKTYWCNL